jgi:hypothetical protein
MARDRVNRTHNFLNGNTQGMGLIVLEAALALAVLVFLIWWTMFSGRRGGEWHDEGAGSAPEQSPGAPPGGATPSAPEQESAVGTPDHDQPAERGGSRKDMG